MEFQDPHRKYYVNRINAFKYEYEDPTAAKIAIRCIFHHADGETIYSVQIQEAIKHFSYIAHIVREWNDHCQTLNGYKPCHWFKQMVLLILQQLKECTFYQYTTIKFRAIYDILNVLQIKNAHKSQHKWIVACFLLINKFPDESAAQNLQNCLDVVIQSQFMYYIANYKSRKGRAFSLPWEYDDPVKIWKHKNAEKRMREMRARAAADKHKYQHSITKYFKPTKSQRMALELCKSEANLIDMTLNEEQLVSKTVKIELFNTANDEEILLRIGQEEIISSPEHSTIEWDSDDDEIIAIMEEMETGKQRKDISQIQYDLNVTVNAAFNSANNRKCIAGIKRKRISESPDIVILDNAKFAKKKKRMKLKQ